MLEKHHRIKYSTSEAINALFSILEAEQERLKPSKKNINTPSDKPLALCLPSYVDSPARTPVDCNSAPLKDAPPGVS